MYHEHVAEHPQKPQSRGLCGGRVPGGRTGQYEGAQGNGEKGGFASMICLRCGSINVESIEHVAEKSGKVRLSLNRMGTWVKCHECGFTFLWDEPQPGQPGYKPKITSNYEQQVPGVYIHMMERDTEDER